ncbi:MAG: 4-hydroxy-tetrahydrodipicolinate synthase [Lachnospiraceae bacterium]|nr:4-hydroxy-tetrahydrodipicolinate synthase [Lachnospiraceae bacterium]
MALFTGVASAIVTPMNADGSVNYDSFGKLIDFQIENGIDAIVVCGTTGEASTLSHEEHIETIRYCVEHVNKRVPVIAGTGSNCTETAVYLSVEAEKAGADGLLLVTPYYNKATQKGLIKHFTTIANAVKIPVVLYNIPGRTGCKMLPETIAELFKTVENIQAVKEASADFSAIAKLARLTEGKMDIYSGNDDQVTPILALGGKGVISVLGNVAPRETHDMVAKFLEGDIKGAIDIQLKYQPLIDALFCEVNPIPVKKAIDLMGMNAGPLRLPLTEMEPANAARLEKEMKAVGLI